ncbi:MAG: bifunctional hydroxymethylpyrimidine kinase/phosphomethylpyrimidine kinase [Selenomonadaceae bacterium]|nr:bifunctional hydroxymethylpyrimidine kinase/phosphomethylpyrimidine kinase [Selenomonadaceae bacterium]
MDLKPVLTIAGSDSSGGAGIQADIKTMLANDVYAMAVITTMTAQNTQGVPPDGFLDSTPEFLAKQLDAVFEDIPPAAVKVGMVSTVDIVDVVAEKLRQYGAKNIVVDPVMVATSGDKLVYDSAIDEMEAKLFPLATLLTPNTHELEVLSGDKISDTNSVAEAAKKLYEKYGCAILATGGAEATDLLYDGNARWFRGRKVDTKNTHGAGCTLSSAIAANLAKGQALGDAISNAKRYVTGALSAGLSLGKGNGPLDHGYNLRK